jgi:hypothetical protein
MVAVFNNGRADLQLHWPEKSALRVKARRRSINLLDMRAAW